MDLSSSLARFTTALRDFASIAYPGEVVGDWVVVAGVDSPPGPEGDLEVAICVRDPQLPLVTITLLTVAIAHAAVGKRDKQHRHQDREDLIEARVRLGEAIDELMAIALPDADIAYLACIVGMEETDERPADVRLLLRIGRKRRSLVRFLAKVTNSVAREQLGATTIPRPTSPKLRSPD